jgi:ActR/RegA family two-component response regulator
MPHLAPAILVFERRPRWEAELKRNVAADGLLVRPCRSAADLLELCKAMPGSALVIDLDVGDAVALRCLELALLQRLETSAIIVAPLDSCELEWPFRELGAMAVVAESIRGEELAELCRRIIVRTS